MSKVFQVIISFLLITQLCAAQDASISYISAPQTKNPGESLSFVCTVIKPWDINVSWMKDGTMLTLGNLAVYQNPRIRIAHDNSTNTYTLNIQNLTASDSGKYKCQLNFDLGKVISKEVDLQVTRAPQILDMTDLQNVRVAQGQSATLICRADGFPSPKITWSRDGQELLFSKSHSFSGANLTILQVKKEDRGRYICEASNGVGEPASKSVLLEVSFGPIMSAKRPKTGQALDYEAELVCKVTSYPPAAISWTRNDKEINNDDRYEVSYLDEINEETVSTLKIKSVHDYHYGKYICKAKNAFGTAQTAMELFAQEIPNEIFPFYQSASSGHPKFSQLKFSCGFIGIFTIFLL